MALLFMDGMDHYGSTSDLLYTYQQIQSGVTYQATGGRFGGGAIKTTADDLYAKVSFGQTAQTCIVQCFVFIEASPASVSSDQLLGFAHSGLVIASLFSNSDLTLTFKRGNSTSLATSSNALVQGAWNYIELQYFTNNTTGTVILNINGEEGINATGLDTETTGFPDGPSALWLGNVNNTSTDVYFDDVIVMDNLGGKNDGFLGEVRIETIYPTADTAQADFTPQGAGDNYVEVDDGDTGPDADTTYNESSTVGHKDLFTMGNLATANISAVHAVQSVNLVRKDDAGARTSRNLVKTGTTTDNGESTALVETYTYALDVLELDPDTATDWTESGVNGVEVGYEVLT